jgi:hypothetical protein
MSGRKYFPLIPDHWLWLALNLHYVHSIPLAPIAEKATLGVELSTRAIPPGASDPTTSSNSKGR